MPLIIVLNIKQLFKKKIEISSKFLAVVSKNLYKISIFKIIYIFKFQFKIIFNNLEIRKNLVFRPSEAEPALNRRHEHVYIDEKYERIIATHKSIPACPRRCNRITRDT